MRAEVFHPASPGREEPGAFLPIGVAADLVVMRVIRARNNGPVTAENVDYRKQKERLK